MPGTRPPEAATSLELTTKLGGLDRGGWRFRLYPDAAEGGGAFLSAAGRSREPGGGEGAPRAAIEAGRRARGQVRRFCAANRLNRLGTLTYAGAGCHDPHELRGDLADFFRALRRGYARSFAYLWVPEWHAGGHGLHAHFAVGKFLPRHRIDQAWGRGFVHIKHICDH